MGTNLSEIRTQLQASAPSFVNAVFGLAEKLIPRSATAGTKASKDFNDPIWKVIALDNAELDICELPLVQRLRRVRQLGLGYLVFPSVHHTRFEHSLGAVFAATRMFDQLSRGAKTKDAELEGVFRTVRLAALLHDSGHPVFSHVGERVLHKLYKKEIAAVGATLSGFFPDLLHETLNGGVAPKQNDPAAAEIVTALLLLSAPMEIFLSRCVPVQGVPNQEALINTVALILGKPRGLLIEERYHHWVRGIVSGDLDADKLDYVARDAYFAGMPVSADVMRLLSQLASVVWPKSQIEPHVSAEEKKLEDVETRVLALRPSGVSAFEMFVMTRSYLFDRLYGHHKTRSAERLMERVLLYYLRISIDEAGWDERKVLDFLYMMGGDDAALSQISNTPDGPHDFSDVKVLANNILDRELPRRAIQIAQRYCVEGSSRKQMGDILQVTPWTFLQEYLAEDKKHDLIDWIAAMTGLNGGLDFIVDPPMGVPIKEDPDVCVCATGSDEAPKPVNQYFDAEQLSNAYRDVKRVAWVFGKKEHTVTLAAGTAAVLQQKFDLSIHPDAVQVAKVSVTEYQNKLKEFKDAGRITAAELANLIGKSSDRIILPTDQQIGVALQWVSDDAQFQLAKLRLRDQIANARVSKVYSHDYLLALTVLRNLIRHAKTVWRASAFSEPVPYKNEDRFQAHVFEFLESTFLRNEGYEVQQKSDNKAGITDIVVQQRSAGARLQSIVIELKSAEQGYQSMVQNHSGQPQQYSEIGNSPISILYCQFKEDSALALADTLEVRQPTTKGSTLSTLCLGTRGFSKTASAGGSTTTPGVR